MLLPRHAEIWLLPYLQDRIQRFAETPPRRVWMAITDHFEPYWHNRDDALARDRVLLWRRQWPEIAKRHADASGAAPQYCFFYPEEEYRPDLMDLLAEVTQEGFGDVEIHIHHGGEGESAWREKMLRYMETLHSRHGLLRKGEDGRFRFGFIHGNWALDNSRPDGHCCGLNNEITLLGELGCYADFTMPCGPGPCQARKLNRIYWAKDDPRRPKSYDTGIDLKAGGAPAGELLMIPGPFAVLKRDGRWRPMIDIGEITGHNPATPARVQAWLRTAPRLGDDLFLKLFSHGTQERNSGPMLGGGLARMLELLEAECGKIGARLRFVTAWQMYQAVEAIRTGHAREEQEMTPRNAPAQ